VSSICYCVREGGTEMHSWTAEWKKGKKIRYNNGQLVFAAFWYLRGVHGLLNFG